MKPEDEQKLLAAFGLDKLTGITELELQFSMVVGTLPEVSVKRVVIDDAGQLFDAIHNTFVLVETNEAAGFMPPELFDPEAVVDQIEDLTISQLDVDKVLGAVVTLINQRLSQTAD